MKTTLKGVYRRNNFQTALIFALALTIMLALCSLLTGCSATGMAKVVTALGHDTNSIIVKVNSPWGSAEMYRNAKP